MALAFRNLDIDPSAHVREWPTEAVLAALERGDLEHWQRLTAEIRREPWGRTARQVEEVLSHSRPYGVSELMEQVIHRARKREEDREREVVAEEVRELVSHSGMSRAEFASRLGTSSSRLSTYVTGRVTPSAALMVRMRHVLDVTRSFTPGRSRGA